MCVTLPPAYIRFHMLSFVRYKARVVVWTSEWALVQFENGNSTSSEEEYVSRKFVRAAAEVLTNDAIDLTHFENGMKVEVIPKKIQSFGKER